MSKDKAPDLTKGEWRFVTSYVDEMAHEFSLAHGDYDVFIKECKNMDFDGAKEHPSDYRMADQLLRKSFLISVDKHKDIAGGACLYIETNRAFADAIWWANERRRKQRELATLKKGEK